MIVKIQDSAKRDLKKLDKSIAIRILKSIDKLEDYPDITNLKRLQNYYPPQRFRVGNYRVDDILVVINVKHRKEAYE